MIDYGEYINEESRLEPHEWLSDLEPSDPADSPDLSNPQFVKFCKKLGLYPTEELYEAYMEAA